MQPTNRSSRILLPVKMWFVYLTLFIALFLNYIPTGHLPAVPDFVALVLAFWCVREPLKIGIGAGFAFGLLTEMVAGGVSGSVVTLIADRGDRYADTYFNDAWLADHDLAPDRYAGVLAEFERTGAWPSAARSGRLA